MLVALNGDELGLPPGNSKIFEWNDSDRFILMGLIFKNLVRIKKLIFNRGSNPFIANSHLEG